MDIDTLNSTTRLAISISRYDNKPPLRSYRAGLHRGKVTRDSRHRLPKRSTFSANSTKRWTDAAARFATDATATRFAFASANLRMCPSCPRRSRISRRIESTNSRLIDARLRVRGSNGRIKQDPGLKPHEFTVVGWAPAESSANTESASSAAAARWSAVKGAKEKRG